MSDLVDFDLLAQGVSVDADHLGGPGYILIIQPQCLLNKLLFKLSGSFIKKYALVEHIGH